MLNLLHIFSFKSLPLASEPVSYRAFYVLLFHVLQIGASISRPSFSRPYVTLIHFQRPRPYHSSFLRRKIHLSMLRWPLHFKYNKNLLHFNRAQICKCF